MTADLAQLTTQPYKPEGFEGERFRVVPASVVASAKDNPITDWLTVTDIGYFPDAVDHRWHRDSGAAQTIIIVCTQGLGYCQLESARYSVSAGQVLAIPPGVPHEYGASEVAPWTIWWAHVTGVGVPALFETAGFTESPVADVYNVLSIATLIDEALTILERDDSQPSLIAACGALTHAFTLIAAQRRLDASAPVEDAVVTVIDFLREHAASSVSRTELANLVGLSESYLAALFRKSTGMGILKYQTRQRMALARELLDTTDLSIHAVASEAGYGDPLYFSRRFRHIHGMSPEIYRTHTKG